VISPLRKVRAVIYDFPHHPDKIVIGLNDRRADLHDVYRLTISTGERVLMRKNDHNWLLDSGS